MADTPSLDEWILDQVADAVIYADARGMIQRWNRAAAALFGYDPAAALGAGLNLIIPETLRAAHWHGFETAMTTGGLRLDGRPTLTRAVHRSGRRLYVEMSFALVRDPLGAVLGAVAVARDVTERVEQERAHRAGNPAKEP